MPTWAVWLFGITGSLFNAVLEGFGAYEAGKVNGQLQGQLAAAQQTINAQQRQLDSVRVALAVRYKLAAADPAAVQRLREWYAAR